MLEIVEATGTTSIHVRLTFKLRAATVSITPFKVYLFPISPHSLPFIPPRGNDMRSVELIHGKGYKWCRGGGRRSAPIFHLRCPLIFVSVDLIVHGERFDRLLLETWGCFPHTKVDK